MDIYFLADPRILYEMKRLCFKLIVVAHTRWLTSFICSVTLLPVTVVDLVCLLDIHFRLTVFFPLFVVRCPVGFTLKVESNI